MSSRNTIVLGVSIAVGWTAMLTINAQAAVYVCTDRDCEDATLATAKELDVKSTDGEDTSIRSTLSRSSEQSIVNGFNTTANTDLGLVSGWHKGGIDPFKGKEHVTVKVYKSGDYVKTCHAFSFSRKLDGPYFATCD